MSETSAAPASDQTVEGDTQRSGKAGMHPLIGTNFLPWLNVTGRYARSIPLKQWPRMAAISLISSSCIPIRVAESLRLRSRIKALDPPAPVFILGHWRSGTTNFHNHMLQDPQFGYVSLLQSLFGPSFVTLERFFRWVMKNKLPSTRPMDSVPVGLDEPMSEDFSMACFTEFTHYHRYFFPKSNDEIFRRTIFFEGVSERGIEKWYRQYDYLLRKIMVASGGKQLILKNPPHTGRVRQLVKYYPDAKFVHVYRNPYHVYASTFKLMRKFLEMFSFQKYDLAEVEHNVLTDYARIMRRFFDDEHLLPPENFIQVRHEDVVADGVGTLRKVYEHLNLPGYDEMLPGLERYVASISDYQTNTYHFDEATIAKVREHCGFAIDRWGYEPPK